jgi:hypothetical protein
MRFTTVYTKYKTLLLIALFVITPVSAASSFDGPLQVKNLYPIFLHVDQPYMEQASMENSFSLNLSHSSTYTVQESGRWLINQDLEMTELNLRYKKIIGDMLEVNLDLPVIALSDGFMDGFLDTFHRTFGLLDYGRNRRPENEFLYEIKRDGRLIVEGQTGVGLGDIRLAVKKPLLSAETLGLSIRADVELPTGNANRGYGNGSIDAAVALLFDMKLFDDFMTYWNFGVVFPGDLKADRELVLKDFMYGGVAVEMILREKFSLLAQIQGQSRIYPRTDLLAVDREAYLLSLGGRYFSGGNVFELSFTEDINLSGAPDFILNFSYKVRL